MIKETAKNLKNKLRTNQITQPIYFSLRDIKNERIINKKCKFKGTFVNRSRSSNKLCIILAGYKPFLFEDVFSRIVRFAPEDMDVCVVSSGLFSTDLNDICKNNEWSYLSIDTNNVCLAQNAAINLHRSANYIFKIDEDIFITERYFEKLFAAYTRAKTGDFIPGAIAPLILVNGFTSRIILEKIDMLDEYEARFGQIKCAAGIDQMIESNGETAKFMWGDGRGIPTIDGLNSIFSKELSKETACPIRFSIGAIMFERSLWEAMRGFDIKDKWNSNMMGKDEEMLNHYCVINSRPIIVSENTLVGHFSFGSQTETMKEFYYKHPERFKVLEETEVVDNNEI